MRFLCVRLYLASLDERTRCAACRGGKKGAESAAEGGRDGVASGMEGNGGKEGGMGQDGEWRKGARKAEKGARMKHAAPASCGGGEGSGARRARRFSPPVGLEIDGRHRPSLPVGEVRTGRDLAVYPSNLYAPKSHQS